jgi:hypothetical protein
MSARVLARGATPLDPRGARDCKRERAQLLARGATPLDPRGKSVRRIRDEARDGLSAAAISLAGSIAVTCVLWLLLRWLG